jgi:hypothetical protein
LARGSSREVRAATASKRDLASRESKKTTGTEQEVGRERVLRPFIFSFWEGSRMWWMVCSRTEGSRVGMRLVNWMMRVSASGEGGGEWACLVVELMLEEGVSGGVSGVGVARGTSEGYLRWRVVGGDIAGVLVRHIG